MKNLLSYLKFIVSLIGMISAFMFVGISQDNSSLGHNITAIGKFGFIFFTMTLAILSIGVFMIDLFRILNRREVERRSSLSMRERLAEIGTFRECGFEIMRNIIRRVDE